MWLFVCLCEKQGEYDRMTKDSENVVFESESEEVRELALRISRGKVFQPEE